MARSFRIRPLARVLILIVLLVGWAHRLQAQDGDFDLDAWHRLHPLSQEEETPKQHLEFGILPQMGVVVGFPNGLAGDVQLSISMRRPGSFGLFVGGGYEFGAAVSGSNVTLGWGGVREIPATVRQLGFSGAFLRYRRWNSEDHGTHRGFSVGVSSSLGALGLTAEVGLSRSHENHWIPVARMGLSLSFPMLFEGRS